MNFSTVPLFMVALIIGLAPMALDIYQVNAWNVGTVKVSPWTRRASTWASGIRASWLTRLGRLLGRREVLACLALAILLMHPTAAHASGLMLVGVAGHVAEPTMAEVKTAIEASNRAFEEFKRTNDERLAQLAAKGVADPLLQAKLEKLNADIDKHSVVIEAFQALEAKFNRLALSGGGNGEEAKQRELEVRQFNLATKAHAVAHGRSTPADFTAEQYDAYKSAFAKYLRRAESSLEDLERRALSVGTDSQGGYLVTPDLSGRMVVRMFETSPMRQYSSQQTIGSDALEGTYDIDEATFGWVAETGTRSDSNTPAVPKPWRIPVHEAYSQPNATQKLIEDANIDIVAWLAKKVGDKIGRGFNAAFVSGSGVGQPRGFATYATAATADTARAWGTFEHVATGTSASFGTDPNGVNKLLTLIHAMKDVYATKSAFYMNRTTLGQVRQLTDNSVNGKYVFVPSFQASMPDTLLGYPVRKLQDMATYSTASALSIAFGDMEETYQIVDRLGITVLVDPYTNKPYVRYYTRARVGGDVLNFESLKFLKSI